ncbi:hypothetical protein SK128_013578 [Halocaridina rubra]|uniref:Ionotropic glutamate receptor L-glutamate and glycine-binding domain-containing protein n=1 Tax=Halocaridina rubra TaxID=373956 RepID=A0AAN9A8G6_HALRR
MAVFILVQVTFAVKQLPGKYDFMSSYVDINNKMALHRLGWWSWNVVEGTKKSLSRPIYISNLEMYKDFGGRELTATVIDNWPFWVLEYPKKGGVIAVSGMDYHVLTTIGQKLNFTFRVELTPDGLWGGVLKDGSVTGMVGVVHRHEAHLAINEFTITDQREKAVDFTKPYFSESITLITPAPTKVLRSYAVFMSFTYKVRNDTSN